MCLTKKLKINMFNRILLYFMLFTCLLTKDGISFAFDKLKQTMEFSVWSDNACEDSMEEEGSTEDWVSHHADLQIDLPHPNELKLTIAFPERNESRLQVLLEQVSPPPRMA